uniref:Uncharacterized protein n=1 Tax=Ditylenchus dipsaci TaxID=166011 RepID=A0A915CY31_9BILA
MAEKANLMEKAALLLEMKEVQKALLEDSLAPSPEVKLGDLTGTLSKCFSENSKVWPLVDASVWLDTIGLLSSVFNMYSTSDIPFSSLIPIWKTCLHLRIENVIEEFKGLIDNYSWPGKDPAKTNFLEVLNNLCGSYGFEQRDLLLTSFFPIAEKLYMHMNIFFVIIRAKPIS